MHMHTHMNNTRTHVCPPPPCRQLLVWGQDVAVLLDPTPFEVDSAHTGVTLNNR